MPEAYCGEVDAITRPPALSSTAGRLSVCSAGSSWRSRLDTRTSAAALVNVVLPTGLTSPRAYFNLDWITLVVMFVIAVVGAILFAVVRPDRGVGHHLHDDLEPTGSERRSAPTEEPPTEKPGALA